MSALSRCVVARTGELHRAPGGEVWSTRGLLSPDDAQLVAQITRCAPIEDHALVLAERFGLDDAGRQDLTSRLLALLEQGHLLEPERLGASAGRADAGTSIEVSAILTHERPEALARVVRDFGIPAFKAGRRLVVSDDGAVPRLPDAAVGAKVHWMDRSHRAAWCQTLVKGRCSDAARWALLPDKSDGRNTVGSSINAVMLHASGKGLSLFDDDICAPLGRGLNSEANYWTVALPGDPTQLQLFDRLDGAVSSMERAEIDPVTLLEHGLGANLSALQPGAELNVNRGLDQNSAQAMLNDGQVLTTMLGVAGDNGMASPKSYLGLKEDDGRSLDERFQARVLSRNVQRAAAYNTLSQSRLFMNACVGLDLRQPLPPFHPSGRNSDGLFGAVLRQLEPDAFRLYRPYMVTHRPLELRRYTMDDFSRVSAIRAPIDTLIELVNAWVASPLLTSRLARMRELGRYLESFGAMDGAQFSEWLVESSFISLSQQINEWESLLDVVAEIRHPVLHSCISGAKFALKQLNECAVETLMPAGMSACGYQSEISAYGRLLQVWPELVEHSECTPLQGVERMI